MQLTAVRLNPRSFGRQCFLRMTQLLTENLHNNVMRIFGSPVLAYCLGSIALEWAVILAVKAFADAGRENVPSSSKEPTPYWL